MAALRGQCCKAALAPAAAEQSNWLLSSRPRSAEGRSRLDETTEALVRASSELSSPLMGALYRPKCAPSPARVALTRTLSHAAVQIKVFEYSRSNNGVVKRFTLEVEHALFMEDCEMEFKKVTVSLASLNGGFRVPIVGASERDTRNARTMAGSAGEGALYGCEYQGHAVYMRARSTGDLVFSVCALVPTAPPSVSAAASSSYL